MPRPPAVQLTPVQLMLPQAESSEESHSNRPAPTMPNIRAMRSQQHHQALPDPAQTSDNTPTVNVDSHAAPGAPDQDNESSLDTSKHPPPPQPQPQTGSASAPLQPTPANPPTGTAQLATGRNTVPESVPQPGSAPARSNGNRPAPPLPGTPGGVQPVVTVSKLKDWTPAPVKHRSSFNRPRMSTQQQHKRPTPANIPYEEHKRIIEASYAEIDKLRADLSVALQTINSQQATIAHAYGPRGPPNASRPAWTPRAQEGASGNFSQNAFIPTAGSGPGPHAAPGGPNMPIDEALQTCCGLAGKWFFVASIEDGGEVKTYAPVPAGASSRLPDEIVDKFFSEAQFKRACAPKENNNLVPPPPADAQLLPPPEAFYPSWEVCYQTVQAHAAAQGYGVKHSMQGKRVDGTPCRYRVRCDKSGSVKESRATGKRKRESRLTDCPFTAFAVRYAGSDEWRFGVTDAIHNHAPYGDIRHVKQADREACRALVERGVVADRSNKTILEDVQASFPNTKLGRSDINNMAAQIRRKLGLPSKQVGKPKSDKSKGRLSGASQTMDDGDEHDDGDGEDDDDEMDDIDASVLTQLGGETTVRYQAAQAQAAYTQQAQAGPPHGYAAQPQYYAQDFHR